MSGEEKGESQTIKHYKHTNLSESIEVLQWTGKKGSLVTLVIDHNTLKVVCAGQNKKEHWIWNGHFETVTG